MTIAHLIWTAFGFGMTGFLLGFWRGRRDLRADLEPLVDQLHEAVQKATAPDVCRACAIEAEIRTEENPHPVPERFHACDVSKRRGGDR